MGRSNIRIKVRRRKVAHLAAQSRGYIVNKDKKKVFKVNKTISPVVKHDTHVGDLSNAITCPFTGHKFVPTNPHPVPTRFGVCITGYDWVEPEVKLWIIPKGGFKQPMNLRKKDYSHTIHKMNQIEYAEKLVQHKLARWIRRNPAPIKDDKTQQDLFEMEFMTPWIALKNAAEERFRDFVVSLYDKLPLTGRFKINPKGTTVYQEELIAEIKDIDGEGHHINDLKPDKSKLMKKAQEITNKVHAKHGNLMCANLRDHKRAKGRIILPQAA